MTNVFLHGFDCHPTDRCFLYSCYGNPILLVSAMQKLPRGGTVIAATDNDPGGVNLARKIREIAEEAARQDLCMVDHRPDTEGQDWNDVQRATAPEPKPSASPAGTAGRPTPHLEP